MTVKHKAFLYQATLPLLGRSVGHNATHHHQGRRKTKKPIVSYERALDLQHPSTHKAAPVSIRNSLRLYVHGHTAASNALEKGGD